MSASLEVWLDCDLCPMQRLGTLAHDRGQVRFHYDKTWLSQQNIAFAIDPQLSLDAGPFFPKPDAGNFGVFLDSSPDRWAEQDPRPIFATRPGCFGLPSFVLPMMIARSGAGGVRTDKRMDRTSPDRPSWRSVPPRNGALALAFAILRVSHQTLAPLLYSGPVGVTHHP